MAFDLTVGGINPFVPNAPFLCLLKTSETIRFSDVFRGERKDALGTNGLNMFHGTNALPP